MICAHCHAPLGGGARFCPACGKAIVSTETQPQDSSPLASALIGREIAGRFRILAKLGEGGMGAVYRGEQMSLKRAVAVKVLRPELSQNPVLVRRFSAEAEAVAKLDHPNTVKVYDFGQDTDGALFIAMEYIEGGSLRDAMRAGPLPGPRALAIAMQVAASLADAHAHAVVHRDLKPDNVMLQDKGRQRDIVRVLDFGIAKLRDDSRATQQSMTQAGDVLGTPQYMAPEQIRGDAIDGRTDVYALGCMLYEMITGRLPFEGTSVLAILTKHLTDAVVPPSQRRPDLGVPPILDQVVMAAMAKDPAGRPPTMERYGELLAGALQVIDPNRSAVLAVPQITPPLPLPAAVAPPLAPMPLSAAVAPPLTPIPPTVRSAGATPAPVPPSQLHYTPPMPPATRAARTAPWLAGLVALGLAGAGTGVYLAVRGTPNDAKDATSSPPRDEPNRDPWTTPGPDPWEPKHVTGAPSTELTPIPAGTRLELPPGFRQLAASSTLLTYSDPTRAMYVALASLDAGTNDPEALAAAWVAKNRTFGVRFDNQLSWRSLGKTRPVLHFTATVQGVEVDQFVVLYIEPAYRLGLGVQFPSSGQDTAQPILTKLITSGIVIP